MCQANGNKVLKIFASFFKKKPYSEG